MTYKRKDRIAYGSIQQARCKDCGVTFNYEFHKCPRTKCDQCKAESRARVHKYPKQVAKDVEYQASPRGKEIRRTWLRTNKGKAYIERLRQKKYSQPDYGEFLAFKNEAFRDRKPCGDCGKPWVDGPRGVTHEIDHIIPIALGGTHKQENLRVRCYDCHLAKTKVDIQEIRNATK